MAANPTALERIASLRAEVEAETFRRMVVEGMTPAEAGYAVGVDVRDLRGLELNDPKRDETYARSTWFGKHGEYYPLSTRWYFDGNDPRQLEELAECAAGLVRAFLTLERDGKRPCRVYVDNYGGAVVAPLEV